MSNLSFRVRCSFAHCSFGIAACFAAAGTTAQDRPYAIGLSQAFVHESNLFRAPDGQPSSSDTYSSTGVFGEVVVPFSRQRFYANGNVRENRYREIGALDNTSYSLDTGLHWASAERLSGTVKYVIAESLAGYGIDTQSRTTGRNLQRSTQLAALARMGLITRLSLEASLQHRTLDYSAPEYASLNYEQDQGTLGLRFSPEASLTLGTGLRYARGRYPQFRLVAPGSYVGDRYTRRDLDFFTTWAPTGLSTFEGRLSFGQQRNSVATQRAFSAATGSLSWVYQPTGKLQLSTLLFRETGAESRYIDTLNSGVPNGNDQSRLSAGVQFGAKYDATAKLQLSGSASRTERSLREAAGVGSRAGEDMTTVLSLGARYAVNRNWMLECILSRESRSATTTLSYAYGANVARCAAQFTIS